MTIFAICMGVTAIANLIPILNRKGNPLNWLAFICCGLSAIGFAILKIIT